MRKARILFFLVFLLAGCASVPSDPYTLQAAGNQALEAAHAQMTATAESAIRANEAAILVQAQTQAAHDNIATGTAQVMHGQATGTALYFEAQATQAAATAQAQATQEAHTAMQTREAFALAELQQGATGTASVVQTQTALDFDRQAAELGREKVITVAAWIGVLIGVGLVLYLGFRLADMFIETARRQRSWVPGADSFAWETHKGLNIVQPRKMFGPALQLDTRTGAATMPQLAAPDVQLYTTLAALAVDLQREVSKRAQWFTPMGKGGRGEAFVPMPAQDVQPPALPLPSLEPLPMLAGKHVLIAGGTGTGKTHTARYLLQGRKQEQVQILDPHHKPGEWPPEYPVIGGGRDFDAIEEAIREAFELMNLRFSQRDAGTGYFAPLTLIVDEIPALTLNKPEAARSLQALGNEGRKISIYLMLLSQSVLVKPLGLEGAGDLRANFATIRLAPLPPGAAEHSPRTAILTLGDLHRPESEHKYLVPALPDLVPNAHEPVPPLPFMVPGTSSEPTGTRFPTGEPPPPGSQAEAEMIRALSGQGYGMNKIAHLLGGRRKDTLDRIRAVIGQPEKVLI